jgi:hypothetical protein
VGPRQRRIGLGEAGRPQPGPDTAGPRMGKTPVTDAKAARTARLRRQAELWRLGMQRLGQRLEELQQTLTQERVTGWQLAETEMSRKLTREERTRLREARWKTEQLELELRLLWQRFAELHLEGRRLQDSMEAENRGRQP